MIGYHASFLKTTTVMDAHADTESDEQEHAAGVCYSRKIVALT